ncbi:MAG: hypothetical protein AAF716_22495 [Cyanobacteria bacterium P01_D01_bin.1]
MASVSPSPGPLSPGNVVSAAIRLYRDRFKTYFGLSARAFLWLIVPVYGWAKYGMHTGLMARLAYQELVNQPETPGQAYQQLQPKMWSFLIVGILFILIFIAVYIGLVIASFVIGFVVVGVVGGLLSTIFGPAGVVVGSILSGILIFILFFFSVLWMATRLFLVEVPLAMEQSVDAGESIGRSWSLTKRSIGRIQLVVLATYLVTLPLLFVTNFLPQIIALQLEPGSAAASAVSLVIFIVSIAANILILPFWQAAKGVLYYDLRSRREGLDLTL